MHPSQADSDQVWKKDQVPIAPKTAMNREKKNFKDKVGADAPMFSHERFNSKSEDSRQSSMDENVKDKEEPKLLFYGNQD